MPQISALLIDLDGTVYSKGKPYPGVRSAIVSLAEMGLPYRFITNTTRRSGRQLVEQLGDMGIEVAPEQMFIAPQAAALYCRQQGYRRVYLAAGDDDVAGEFDGLTLTADNPEAVVLGDLGEGFSYARLNELFAILMGGAQLVAMQKGRYWLTEKYGPTLDLGPYVAALEYATGREAVVVGKPARAFFELAAEGLDVPIEEIAVVGDSVENDLLGAREAGLQAVLVRTGVYEEGLAEKLGLQPELVLDSLADLPGALQGIRQDA